MGPQHCRDAPTKGDLLISLFQKETQELFQSIKQRKSASLVWDSVSDSRKRRSCFERCTTCRSSLHGEMASLRNCELACQTVGSRKRGSGLSQFWQACRATRPTFSHQTLLSFDATPVQLRIFLYRQCHHLNFLHANNMLITSVIPRSKNLDASPTTSLLAKVLACS